jgi:hypothetical protein
VHHTLLVCVIEGLRDRGDDLDDHVRRHAFGIGIGEQLSCVSAVDVVHRKPQPVLELAPVVEADDIRVP